MLNPTVSDGEERRKNEIRDKTKEKGHRRIIRYPDEPVKTVSYGRDDGEGERMGKGGEEEGGGKKQRNQGDKEDRDWKQREQTANAAPLTYFFLSFCVSFDIIVITTITITLYHTNLYSRGAEEGREGESNQLTKYGEKRKTPPTNLDSACVKERVSPE
eukprot:GCRY01005864.1.p1 GENE.GCRY01005864.1~~GCRY01005864.1.p1  ORF type:complete len:159 (+),score=11.29 GCRY01005864.1:537-1013(+)